MTIVVAELDRLEALAARLGQENADRLIPPVATTLRRLARNADLVARVGHARFQVLLPETDEVQAINYVERVREACDMWLDAAAVSVRMSVGWASAAAGTSLRDALRVAEQRMHADRARGSGTRPASPRQAAPSVAAAEPTDGSWSAASAPTASPVQAPAEQAPAWAVDSTTPPAPPAAGPADENPPYPSGPASGPTL